MATNPLVKFIRGTEANKPNPVDGQILFTTDTYKLYIDDATAHHLINPDIPVASSSTPSAVAQTAVVGSSSNFARADHVHNIVVGTGDANGQVKIAGQNASVKGLGAAAYKGMASSIVSTDTGVPTAAQVANAISTATSGLTGAMHFAGTSTTAITDGGTENPTISGYTTKTAGDIVLYNGKEYVWTGTAWEELGDESSYALKTITITAGDGLSGGGTLEANRTISHAQPSGASAGAKGSATANNNTFLKTVTTDKFGHITASSTEALALATSSMIGGIKIGYTESGKNYAVKLSDGKAYVTVPWENSEYSLTAATASVLGGIKVGYTTSGKNYKVQLDSNNNAYVNVPWTDNNDNTTYTFASGTTKGAFQVTPSGGTAQTVSIYGWGTAAELASATSVQNNNTTLPTGAAVQSYVSTAVSDAALRWNEF